MKEKDLKSLLESFLRNFSFKQSCKDLRFSDYKTKIAFRLLKKCGLVDGKLNYYITTEKTRILSILLKAVDNRFYWFIPEKFIMQIIKIDLKTDWNAYEVHPIAVAYYLYKYAEDKKRYHLTITELNNSDWSPNKLGITQLYFENTLRWLQEDKSQLVKINLKGDIDIFLREKLNSVDVLKKGFFLS